MNAKRNNEKHIEGLKHLLSNIGSSLNIHPGNDVLAAYQTKHLEYEDRKAVMEHLASCSDCQEKVEWLEQYDEVTELSDLQEEKSGVGMLEKAREAIARLISFPLPARMAMQAVAATWSLRDVPDEEKRLDREGDGPFEAYLQRYGDRLVVAVYSHPNAFVEIQDVRDADTGEPLCTKPESRGGGEWLFDLGTAGDLRGRAIVVTLMTKGNSYRLEARIGSD